MTSRRKTGHGKLISSVGLGLAVSIFATLIMTAGATFLIMSQKITEDSVGYAACIIILFSVFLGTTIAGIRADVEKRLIACIVVAASYLLCLLLTSLLAFNGKVQSFGTTVLLICGAAIAAGLMVGKRNNNKRKIPKIRF